MALQVWLPLNGTLENKGLSNVTVTNSGATVDNNGKIGKCYYFNGSDARISCSSINLTYPITIAGWFKPTDRTNTTTQYWLSYNTNSDGTVGHLLGLGTYGGNYAVWHNGTVNSITTSISNNNWYHLAVTMNANKVVTAYLNGELIWQTTSSGTAPASKWITIGARSASTTGGVGGASYYYKGYANDVRVYNHCLSAKEVKEISKGLILHYKLDDAYVESTTNIASSLTPQSNVGGWGKITSTKIDTNYYHIKHYYGSSSNPSYWSTFVYTLPSSYTNKIITFSARLKNINYHDINTSNSWIFFGQGNNGTYPTHGSATYYINQLYENMELIWTGTLNNTNNYLVFEIWSSDLNTNGTIELDLYDIQIEEKDHVTGYINGTRTATTIYDSSGYCNHGSITGTLTTNSDSPRYTASTTFDGNTSGIVIENLNIGNIINTAMTYSFWIKPNGENGARSVYFGSYSSTTFSVEKNTANKLRLYWGGNPDLVTNLSISDGQWLHIVVTKNGTNDMKVYLNGSLVQSFTNTFSNLTFPTTYRLGRDTRSGDGTPYKGLMSDFRIYATALSEDDVKELYNTSAFVTNNGVFAEYELYEDNLSDVKKTGLLETADFYENGAEDGYSLDTDKTRVASNYIISEEFIEI